MTHFLLNELTKNVYFNGFFASIAFLRKKNYFFKNFKYFFLGDGGGE